MKLIVYAASLILLLLAEGTGAWLKRILGIARRGYHAPIGFALLFSVAQVFYYPAEMFNYSMKWVVTVTVLLLLFGVVCVIYDWQDMKQSLFRRESLILLGLGAAFLFLYEFRDVLASDVDQALITTSLRDLPSPLWQGYYQFADAFSWLLNIPHRVLPSLPAVTSGGAKMLGLGFVFTITSSMLIIDMVRLFHLRNHWFEFALLFYLLFNGNYTAWTHGIAWSGLSWSILFVTLSVFIGYIYLREENEQIKYLFLPVFGAGLACDNSFGLSGLAILYGFLVYLFSIRKIRSFFDLFTFLIPHAVYVALRTSEKVNPFVSFGLLVLFALFLMRRYRSPLRRWIARTEEFFFDHWKEIFLIAVPVVLVLSSAVLVFLNRGKGLTSYLYYFDDFHAIPGVRDYIFLHSSILEIVINIFRWGGLVCLIALAKEKCDLGIRMLLICVLLVFLNPLTTPAISYMTGPSFFHSFHVLFCPVTESLMFLYVYRMFQWNVIGQWVLEIVLCFGALLMIGGILL